MKRFCEFLKNRLSEKGQGMVEYALILAFVVAFAVALSSSGITEVLGDSFNNTAGEINEQANQ